MSENRYYDEKTIATRAMSKLGGKGGAHIPNQATPISRRGPKFYRDTLEGFESKGIQQIRKNYHYNEAYAQIKGEVNITHFISGLTNYEKSIAAFLKASDYELPEYIKNYDKIGPIVEGIATKYVELHNRYNIDFVDPVSEGELDRELDNMLMQSTLDRVQMEKARRELMWNIGDEPQGLSEEEREAYIQEIEERMRLISSPDEIVSEVQRRWRPTFIKWLNSEIKLKEKDHSTRKLYSKSIIDMLCTGKYFQHHVPTPEGRVRTELWDVREVFHSQNKGLEYPQYANYIGKIDSISIDNIITEYGDELTEKEIKDLINYRDSDYEKDDDGNIKDSIDDMLKGDMRYGVFPGTFANEALSAWEHRTGDPQSFVVRQFEDIVGVKNTYLNDYLKNSSGIHPINVIERAEVSSDDDVVTRTQVYWTSYEKVTYVFLEDDGVIERFFVDERLMEDFKERHDLTAIRSITIAELEEMEAQGDIKPNTMCSTLAPVTYFGVLLRTEGHGLKEDKVLKAGPVKYQIRGEGNDLYKELKPVTGVITKAFVPKLMPYQMNYNYNLNLSRKYAEKEIGRIFLYDVGLTPEEFSETGDPYEDYLDMQDRMRNDAMVPVDASRKNLREGRGMEYNPIGVYDMSMGDIIKDKMQTADMWLNKLYESAGISPQVMQDPKYVTAEGIKVSESASQLSMDYIFNEMEEAKQRDYDIYLKLLQHCQSDKDRIIFKSLQDDGTTLVQEFLDEHIMDRVWELVRIDTSEDRKKIEEVRNWILQTNTLQDDTSKLVQLILSDDFTTMIDILNRDKAETEMNVQRQQQEEREHELNIERERNEAAMEQARYREEQLVQADAREARKEIVKELIKAYSRQGKGIPQETIASIKDIISVQKLRNDTEMADKHFQLAEQSSQEQIEIEREKIRQNQERLALEERRLDIRDNERQSDNFRRIVQSK